MANKYIKSLIPVIESNYEKFSPTERAIADFFVKNRDISDMSAKTVAGKLFVSEASLSRFSQKCGFSGYREFIYQYLDTYVEEKDKSAGEVKGVLNSYQELLNSTYSLLDEHQILRICKYIGECSRVFVAGRGSSGLAAKEMELRFMRIGVDINALQDSEFIRMQSVFLNSHHLAIGISLSGQKEDVLYLLRAAHRQGAKTILITEKNREGYSEYCDEVLLVPSLQYLNEGNRISPQFPVLMMLDILYSYYIESDSNLKIHLHNDTLKALRKETYTDV